MRLSENLENKTLSGPDAFDKSRFAMTFLTMEILCSSRLVLEGKTGKE